MSRMVNRVSLLIGVVAALSLAGCKKSGPAVVLTKVAFEMPQGWTKAEAPEKGISIAVPSGWISLQAMLAEIESRQPLKIPNGMGTDNPQVADQMNKLMQQSGQMDADEVKALIKE